MGKPRQPRLSGLVFQEKNAGIGRLHSPGVGRTLRCIRRVSTERARFAVIDVDLKLSGFADIAERSHTVRYSPFRQSVGRNNVLLVIHYHGDRGAVIGRN